MKSKFNGILTLLLALTVQFSFAQKAVTGTVSDESGPLPGVSVVIKGTKTGTETDFDGKYSIQAKAGDILQFSYVGMEPSEVTIGNANVYDVKLKASNILEEVVITALGMKRDKKALGYSSQKLDEKTANSSPTTNFVNNLSGKVAGLEVKTNSNFGGSTNIVLRGVKSITGNNQALIVVDGVPVNNSNLNSADAMNARDGFDFGNSGSDLDPNNIESVNVLKGAAATALYGSEAANGAIMITTKKGKKNSALGITFNSSVSLGTIDKSTFAKYQKQYGGGGYDGQDNFFVEDVNGDGIDDLLVPTGYDISYGNAYDPNLLVYQWNAFVPGNANYGKPTKWVAATNDPTTFFETASNFVNSINLNAGDDKNTFNANFTNNIENGVLPNSKLLKNYLSGNYSRQFSEKLNFSTFVNFSDQSTKGRNSVGYGDNLLTGFRQWWQTNVDIKELKQEYFRNITNTTWNMGDPISDDFAPAYWNNPYWDRYQNYETDNRNRVLVGANLSYDITKNFNILGRVTVDNSKDRQEQRKAVTSHAEEFGIKQLDESSGYNLYTRDFSQQTYDFISTYDFDLTQKTGLKLLAGYTFKHSKSDSFESSTTGGLITPNLYTLSNSNTFVAPLESEITYKKSGIYGQASFDFNNILFLEGTLRQDQSTALPKNNNKYNYMSVGTSFIFSGLMNQSWLKMGKLRLSYAEVGNDPGAGLAGAKVFNDLISGTPMYANSSVYVDFDKLKPEEQKSWEVGLEAGMFENRLNFDISLYKTNTTNQIFRVPQSTSTGYSTSLMNAGELENKGVEVSISGLPIKTENFKWKINLNWSKNKNKLLSLDENRPNLQLASFQSGITLNATVGEAYGTIKGTDYLYDDNGNPIVGEDGNYLQTSTSDNVIGNIQANWNAGIYNNFAYKNFELGFLIDIKHGGDVFSLDQGYGQDTGLYPETAGINDLGYPVRNSLDENGGYINDGVMENPDYTPTNGEPEYITNTIRVDAHDSSEASGLGYGITANPDKAFVYDASYVKLREVGLTYNISSKNLERTFIKGASLSFIGNNLWIIHKNLPYADPEAGTSSGNVQGYQSGVMPSVKVYSFNVKLSF